MSNQPMNDEYRPACPKCEGTDFKAVLNRRIINVDKCPVMIICSNLRCQTVVGVLAYSDVYNEG